MKEVKLLSLSKCENKSKCEELSKNSSNFNNNSIKNVEIKKETQELRPNSEIKTELATAMPTHNFIENSLVILTKQTLDIFLRQKNPSELIALYTFYYYTAKWQQTNQIKCTSSYVAKALHWKVHKVLRVKKQLIEFGLIEEIRRVDPETKRVVGFYIKMNYIFKKETLETQQIQEKNQYAQIDNLDRVKNNKKPLCPKPQCGNGHTNALSTNNKNALSTDNLSKKESKKKKQLEQDNISLKSEKNNSASISKKQTKAKKTKSKPVSFDEIIDAYTVNEDLRLELREHLKVRKLKKATLSSRAIELSLKKLDKLADSDEEKIQIVQNSIMYGWIGFFELNEKDKNKLNNCSSYNLNAYEKSMDTFEGEPEEPPERLGLWL